MEMMRLFIHDKCLEQVFGLPKTIQKKVLDFQRKFRQDSKAAAIHLEPIHDFKDPQLRTARIDQKYRAIVRVPPTGTDYYLLWVDNHDEAMDWARSKTFIWNEHTSAAQVFDTPVYRAPGVAQTAPEENRLFAAYTDEQLLAIGVPDPLLALIHTIRDLNDLGAQERHLPPDVFESLFYLADNGNINVLIQEIREGSAQAQESINNRRSFVVADDSLLEEYLNGELSKWQVFLHPSQRKLVEANFKGPVKVTGGGGTGKTVVALHRLKQLTDRHTSCKPVLFTTYTLALTENLKELVHKMQIQEGRYLLRNIDALARELGLRTGILNASTTIVDMPGMETAANLWQEVADQNAARYDATFLEQEYQQVWLYNDLQHVDEYFRVSRIGRGKPISRKQKVEVAALFSAYAQMKQERGYVDRAELFNRLSQHFKNEADKPFSAIIADEIQDMSSVELRFLRSLTAEGDNDLFFVGDPYQKIYSRKINFAAAGIHVRGTRSKRLRINYRTTEEIKRLAISTIRGFTYDDFDGSAETMDGYLSLYHGDRPAYHLFKTFGDEVNWIISFIQQQTQLGMQLTDMVLGFRKREQLREMRTAIHKAGISYFDMTDRSGNRQGLRLCTFHSLKGLEFKTVLLAGVHHGTAPLLPAVFNDWEKAEQEAHLQAERSLLYVAMTRAMQQLVITGTGVKSGLINT